jgi:hypothetical protein
MRCISPRLQTLAYPLIFCLTIGYQDYLYADLISPLIISNYSPVVAIYGLPYVGDAEVLKPGDTNTRLMYDVSSHYAIDENANEYILLDGETHRGTFIYRRGITNGLEAGLVVPYLDHMGGGLDSFIYNWHKTFGMPQGGRQYAPYNQLHYKYVRHTQTLFDMHTAASGIGDVRLQSAWQLQSDDAQASALALSIKFPTGDSREFRGSGAADVAFWYKQEARQDFFGYQGGSFYSLGMLYLGHGDILPDMARSYVGFGNVGAGVFLSNNVIFISQLDINSPFYSSSDLVELGSYAIQLSLGGKINISQYGQIDLGLAEDLIIDASPDVTFHVAVDIKF